MYSSSQQSKCHHPLLPQDQFTIQRNETAVRDWKDHVVTWSFSDSAKPGSSASEALKAQGRGAATGDGLFVNSLRFGDVITIWAKARFPGWVNYIESVKIDVYWAV